MNDPYDSYEHGPDVEVVATHAPGGTDDLEDGSEAEAPPRRRSSIASGLGALVRPSREARFGLAALLSFLILVTVLIMKREKAKAGEPEATKASAKGHRRIPVARIHVMGPSPSELALASTSSAPPPEALGPPATSPPVPPPAAESKTAGPPLAPSPSEAEAVPAPMEPIPPAAAEGEKTPQLPPDLAAEPSEKPGAETKDGPAPQPTSPADPVPAPSPSAAPGPVEEASPAQASPSSPAPAAASTTLEILEPSPPAASGPSSSDAAPPTPESGTPAEVTSPPAPAPSPIVELPNPAAPTAPPASEPPAPVEPADSPASGAPTPMPSPDPPAASPATASPASPDPVANDAAPAPELPAPADSRIPPTSPAAEDPPAPSESQAGPTPADAPAPELPAPVDPRISATPPPAKSPEPVEAPDVAPSAALEEAPARAEDVPRFAPPPEPAPPALKPTENASRGSLVTIPNVGKRRLFGGDLERPDPPADTTIERPKAPAVDVVDRVESVPHVVQRGENFWTISRLSYGSGRFYKALWAANRHLVPVIDELYVDTTILIPPPEALDKALILPAKTTRPSRPAEPSSPVRGTSRSTLGEVPAEPEEIEVHLPTAPSSRRGSTTAEEVDPEPGAGVRPRLPAYKIRANETLRSIANHTLGDSHRADEILELNRTVIKDPNDLTTGQEIKLPADARVGRRAR